MGKRSVGVTGGVDDAARHRVDLAPLQGTHQVGVDIPFDDGTPRVLQRLGDTELAHNDPEAFVCRDGAGAVQALLARLPPPAVLPAGPGGSFPLAVDEMRWQVDFLARAGG